MNYKKIFSNIIFWPVATISILMNVWLFSSFFTDSVTIIFGGILGFVIDIFKLHSLYNFDTSYRLYISTTKRSRLHSVISFPSRPLIYYLFFMFVSAGASLLFGLIDIDRSIEKQHTTGDGITRHALERDIKRINNRIDKLDDTEALNKTANKISDRTNKIYTYSILAIEKKKKEAREEVKKLEAVLVKKELKLASIKEESKGTFEVFDYLADIIPGADSKQAKIIFLLLIIISIEILTEETRGAMTSTFRVSAPKPSKKVKTKNQSEPKGPRLGGKKYKYERG